MAVSTRRSPRRTASWLWSRVSVLVLALVAAAPRAGAQEERSYPREFIRAMRRFVGGDASARAEGERALRQLGARVVDDLAHWIESTSIGLSRARRLLAELDPEAASRVGGGGDPLDDPTIREFFVRRLDDGWRLVQEGDYFAAKRLAEGLEALDGESSRVYDYRRLRRACEKHLLRSEVLEPLVEFQERVYEIGETPVILFRLINRQARRLVVDTDRGLLGTLEVEVHKSFVNGTEQKDILSIPIKTLDGLDRIVLPARRRYEREFRLDLGEALPPREVVVRLSVVGRFRPSQWGIGNRNVSETLDVTGSSCWIVPEGEKDLVNDPIRKLEAAIIFRDLQTYFTAAQLAAWESREDSDMAYRLLEVLVGSLEELDEAGFRVADRLLKEVGGVPRREATDRAFWRDWLAAREPEGTAPRRREVPRATDVDVIEER